MEIQNKGPRAPVWFLRLVLLHQIQSQTCDYQNDNCFFKSDSECDADLAYCRPGTDCFDCDTCRQYDLDCDGCVGYGCLYCPTDGLCASGVIPQDYFLDSFNVKGSACSSEDYLSLSCVAAGADGNVFNDLLYTEQSWVYDLIDVESVWTQGITGAGVHIRINDDGVMGDQELSARFDKERSCELYMPYDLTEDTHGTSCAAIAAGEANNDKCSAGIAPGATVSSCAILSTDPNPPVTKEHLDGYSFLVQGIEYVDISSNSWVFDICARLPFRRRDRMLGHTCPFPNEYGQAFFPCVYCSPDELALITAPGERCVASINGFCSLHYEGYESLCQEYSDMYIRCEYRMLNDDEKGALETAIQVGRAGKGIIFTFAAGNDNVDSQDVNMDGFVHSRYTISVAAVGRDGFHASYSTPGAPNLISAPGGDGESVHNHVVANAAGGCYDATIGTSFAVPVVSGVIALMLERNPDLGWRDVQAILVLTARQTDLDDESWVTNGAGLHHSYKYGFGIVNAYSAVAMAND